MACGAFVLSDNQRDVFSLFKAGEHLACFEGADDLLAKVKYYLAHEDERKAIADKGKREVLANHTYVHRIQEMISII
jgi:spore maturation protein CgeB